MHVLVSGGTGFIGRALCAALVASGHQVTVLTRSPASAPTLPATVTVIEDLGQARDVDAIVNLAGEPLAAARWTDAQKTRIRDSRLGTTRRLLEWVRAQGDDGPRILVSGSAIGYYGQRDDAQPLTESSPPGDDFAARLAVDWEAEALKAEDCGLRVALVRTGLVLGTDGGALQKMLPPFRLGAGGPMGTGLQWMSWIHRADHVRLLLWLLENDDGRGAYNATAPAPVINRDFADALGKALHRPTVLTTPAVGLRLLFGEMAELLLTGQRVLPARAEAEGFVFEFPTIESAFADLLG